MGPCRDLQRPLQWPRQGAEKPGTCATVGRVPSGTPSMGSSQGLSFQWPKKSPDLQVPRPPSVSQPPFSCFKEESREILRTYLLNAIPLGAKEQRQFQFLSSRYQSKNGLEPISLRAAFPIQLLSLIIIYEICNMLMAC